MFATQIPAETSVQKDSTRKRTAGETFEIDVSGAAVQVIDDGDDEDEDGNDGSGTKDKFRDVEAPPAATAPPRKVRIAVSECDLTSIQALRDDVVQAAHHGKDRGCRLGIS